MDIKIDTRSRAQKRADYWADLYRRLAEENPTASTWQICIAIGEATSYTTQAVYYCLRDKGVLQKRKK